MNFFNEETKQKLRDSPKNLTASTILSYETLLKRLYRYALNKHIFDIALLKSKKAKIKEYIQGDDLNLNIKRNMLNAIINLLNISRYEDTPLVKEYVIMFRKIAEKAEEARNYKGVSEEDMDNKITTEEIKKLFNMYKKEVGKNTYNWNVDTAYNFLAFLVYLAPLRNGEYTSLIIVKNPKEGKNHNNHIDMKNKAIVLGDHKTVKTHGTRTIEIPDDLHKIIKDYAEKSNTNVMFPKRSNVSESMSVSGLTHYLNGLFKGKKISTQALRQSYVSELKDSGVKMTTRKKIAKDMGHTLLTSELKYGKYSKVNN